jgi:CRISPR-associated protein Cmr1
MVSWQMKELKATFLIVTPMFLGDANQHATSIRPPSIKGALRFWWRALNWSTFRNGAQDDASALRELHREEARLFGSAADNQGAGQGQFLLRAKPAGNSTWKAEAAGSSLKDLKPDPGHTYLSGQALWSMGSKKNGTGPHYLRDVLLRQSFDLTLAFKPGCGEETAKSLANAVRVWGMLGGVGSRCRRGFGSIAIQSMAGTGALPIPVTPNDYQVLLMETLGPLVEELPPFSALSTQALISKSMSGDNAWALLGKIGKQQQLYRSYGRKDTSGIYVVGNQKALQNFSLDHDLMHKVAHGQEIEAKDGHPKRMIFGLPHNYRFSDKSEAALAAGKFERRASPLLIHLHEFSTGEIWAIQSVLKSVFLPPNTMVSLNQMQKGKKRNEAGKVPINADYGPLKTYIESFADQKVLYG